MDDDPFPERPLPPPTWRDALDRIVAPERAGAIRAVAAVVALALVGGLTWWALKPPPAPATELSLPMAGSTPTTATATTPTSDPADAELVVHAAGAVTAPGLRRLAAGSRVADLLAAAGGPSADADLDRVNLAAVLVDGQRVWFPRVGQAAPPPVPGEGGPAPPGSDGATAAPVDLNVATAEQLEALPGIGPSIAAAIIEHRERRGPFRSVDDLLDVPGIGPARIEDLRALVTV